MAKKLENMSTQSIISAQQIIQMGSEQMHGFFGEVSKKQKEGLVSLSYKNELENHLRKRINGNNEIVDNLDKEIFKRIERDFGGTTPKIMPLLVRKFEEEKQDIEAIKKEVAFDKEVKQLKKSKEKKL
jgi:uncharacterized hydantoinase/oxoprolinase family protein